MASPHYTLTQRVVSHCTTPVLPVYGMSVPQGPLIPQSWSFNGLSMPCVVSQSTIVEQTWTLCPSLHANEHTITHQCAASAGCPHLHLHLHNHTQNLPSSPRAGPPPQRQRGPFHAQWHGQAPPWSSPRSSTPPVSLYDESVSSFQAPSEASFCSNLKRGKRSRCKC
ncbi:hypothetical protein HYDPIDRAFT_115322 [Hydnomerulius pinastri MD-312]|uniref:Uncharacterized protein n=1 Tax=Hydnomerulius pinastri MD-312 TaxID=994086 RepID=A0A0C9W5A6_9AGAM|nr:hypothetical protein HYDPIDRAFT_115322 [Hydnomerulius pinastri MD-312]